MSTIKVTNLRHESASSSNITLDSSNNVTTANNFTAGGTIGCTGDLTVTSGNLVLSSGNGIDFSAAGNAGGMTSELLDDYEEGTWTPEYANVNSPTYSAQNGRYVKIGTLCHISGRIALSNKGTANAGGGNPLISLPFDKATGSDGFRYVAGFQWENLSTSVSNVYGLMYLTSYISIYKQSANNTSSTFLTHADLANNSVLHFSVAYRTA